MWNLEQNDNYVLSVDGSGFEAGEVVNCISFNKVKGKTTKNNSVDFFNVRYIRCIFNHHLQRQWN